MPVFGRLLSGSIHDAPPRTRGGRTRVMLFGLRLPSCLRRSGEREELRRPPLRRPHCVRGDEPPEEPRKLDLRGFPDLLPRALGMAVREGVTVLF